MQRFYKSIIYTLTPLRHKFQVGNKLQIYPIINGNAPTNPKATHFPLFLEFMIEMESELFKKLDADIIKYSLLQNDYERILISLLSVFTNHRFFKYDRNYHWGILTPNKGFDNLSLGQKELFNYQFSSWILPGYLYSELVKDLTITNFTQIDLPVVQFKPNSEYFKEDPVENQYGEIVFPDSVIPCFNNYFQLTLDTQKRVKSAVYLICNGIDLSDKMRSVAFLSFVSSIETMISLEINDDNIDYCKSCKTITNSLYHCEKCGSPIWGIRKKFVEYLKKFVAGGMNSQKKYKKVYDLRSSIAHSGRLFLSDLESSLDDLDKKDEEWLMKLYTLQIARYNIVNWLRYDKKASC